MDYKTVGLRIKEQRERVGLLQNELGKIIGVSQQCVSGWESGRTTPDVLTLAHIAHACSIPIQYFLQEENTTLAGDYAGALTVDETQLLKKYRLLTPEQKSALLVLLTIPRAH